MNIKIDICEISKILSALKAAYIASGDLIFHRLYINIKTQFSEQGKITRQDIRGGNKKIEFIKLEANQIIQEMLARKKVYCIDRLNKTLECTCDMTLFRIDDLIDEIVNENIKDSFELFVEVEK